MKPFKGLVVEGTSGVGKSTLIDGLIRRHAASARPRKIRTLVHLAQSHTYGPLAVAEGAGTLTVAENQKHLERIVGTMEWLHACVQEHEKPWCFVIVDTLHLTHCLRPGAVQWTDVEAFDRRLAALGCKLIALQAAPATIWERGIVPRVGEQFLEEYAKKFGRNHEEVHAYFVREQEMLIGDFFPRSSMAKRLMRSEGELESLVEEAYGFWNEEGE
jgi:hypothetical protein